MIINAFRKMVKMGGENNAQKTIVRVAGIAVAGFGVWSSFDRDMFSKLFLGFSFDYWSEERPAALCFAVNLSIEYVCFYYLLCSYLA
jgi:hypothetical protein